MEVSKLFGRESCGRVDFPEYQRRLQPITLGRRQDGMISLQRPQEFMLRRFCGATPEFGQNYSRGPNEPSGNLDQPLMTSGA